MLVDTHAHLNFPDYQKDLNKVINRAIKNGVKQIICVSSNIKDSQKAIEIAKKYPGIVFAAVGIHPHNTNPTHYNDTYHRSEIEQLKTLSKNQEVIAIGECGLDYSPAPPGEKDRTKEEQWFLFQEQIKLALQLNKPLIVHSRKAFDDTLEMLKPFTSQEVDSATTSEVFAGIPRGVFHCYAAGRKGIEKVNQLGFYFGVDGNLTYDEGLQNVFKKIPLNKILLETDCPFLSPEPLRGQRNEPANVKIINENLAKIKGISLANISEATSKNSQILFNFPS